MKNLKKVLALVLALATVLGLGVTASAKEYTDADSIEYTEAVDVMSAIGVLGGFPDGSFAPTENLTREQAAKMVAYIMNGGKDINDLYAGANTFTDCNYSWAKGYIAFAQQAGVISGVGNGKFDPTGTLTGVALAKMMLVSLGYDAVIEKYQSDDSWALNIISDAEEAGLLKGLDSANLYNPITREQASQMMFNTLQATMVKYTNKGTNIDMGNGIIINTGATAPEDQKWTDTSGVDFTNADGLTSASGETIELCEKQFPKLYRDNTSVNGQKGYTWKLQGETEAISSFVADETILATSTNGTSISDLTTYSTTNTKFAVKLNVGSNTTADAGTDYEVFVNGTEVAGYQATAGSSLDTSKYYFDTTNLTVMKPTTTSAWADVNGNGVKIEFIDTNDNANDAEKIYVTLYDVKVVGKAPVVKTDTATGKDKVTITGLSISNVETSKVTGYEGLEKDDIVTVVKMADGSYTINKLTPVVGQATAEDANGTLTVDGKAIKVAKNANSSFSTYSEGFYKDVTFYCDEYGYGVYAKAVTTESKDYLMVIENGAYTSSNVTSASNKSYVVKADGTTATIDVKKVGDKTFGESGFTVPTTGVVYSYTVNSDNTYNLTAKSNAYTYKVATDIKSAVFGQANASLYWTAASGTENDAKFDKGVSAMTDTSTDVYSDTNKTPGTTITTIKGNADTVYVLRDIKTAGTNALDKDSSNNTAGTEYKTSWTVYTGYTNVIGADNANASAVVGSDGYADVVFIYNYEKTAAVADTSDYVYVTNTTANTVYKADGTIDYYTFNAIVNGEVTTVKADSTAKAALEGGKGLYIVEYTDGKATSATVVDTDGFDSGNKYRYNKVTAIAEPDAGMIVAGSVSYSYTEDCVVYEIAADGTVTTTDVFGYEAIASSGNIYLVNNNADGSATATVNMNTLTEIYIQK